MTLARAYEEIVEFIAAGSDPRDVADFRPSETARAHVDELVAREKDEVISAGEKAELDHYVQLEHIMRLAKARARQFTEAG